MEPINKEIRVILEDLEDELSSSVTNIINKHVFDKASVQKPLERVVRDNAVKQARGPHLFTQQPMNIIPHALLASYMVVGEYVVHQDARTGNQCTNYGRFIMFGNGILEPRVFTQENLLPLTDEVLAYLKSNLKYHHRGVEDMMTKEMVQEYQKFALAHNTLHQDQIAAIKASVKQDEPAKLRAALKVATKRLKDLDKRKAELVEYEARLNARKKELDAREEELNALMDDGSSEYCFQSNEDDWVVD